MGVDETQDENGFTKMHLMTFGVKKAGMTDANDEKLTAIMQSTNENNEKYFTKQKNKISCQDDKIKEFMKKIEQYKSNSNLWDKAAKEAFRR